MTRPAVAAVLMTLVLSTAAAGCTGDDGPDDGATTKPSPTATTHDPVPQADALDAIDIDGAEGSPITWRLPEGTQPTDPAGVAQRYIAMFRQAGTPRAEADPALIPAIVEDDYAAVLRVRLREAKDEGDTPQGPQWLWLNEPRLSGTFAFVQGCADEGYFQVAGTKTPVTDRAKAVYAELKRVDEPDGTQVWKIHRYNSGPLKLTDPFEKQCPDWATHQP